MSTMWNITVANKGNSWIDLYVEFGHPDAGPFPEDTTFALQLLTSEAYGFDDNYNYIPTSPLGESIPHDVSYQPYDLESIKDKYISKAIIYQAENLPWDESAAHEKVNQLCCDQGLTSEDDDWDDAWEQHWIEFWEDPANLPWAKYRIWVTDPKWIEHLEVGKHFETASYSEEGPWLNENRLIELEEPTDGAARKAVPGFKDSEIPPRDSSMNPQLIRSMAESGGAVPETELSKMLHTHAEFLAGGGEGGRWERLHVSGIPINLYYGSSSKGEQMKLSMKKLATDYKICKGGNFSSCDMSGGIFENVDFSGATFIGALLTDAFFAGANFEGSQLVAVDFTGSDLTGANFRGANLRDADFEIANCEDADFTGADLTGATFKGATLIGVKR